MSTGTRNSHVSRDTMLRCAIRSRDAFLDLSSLVSFVIALNMDDDGSYEAAFYKLRNRHRDPVHSAWLDQLKLSHVCNFSANFRVGIVVNPYTCEWARSLYRFAVAHVPIWIFWGSPIQEHHCRLQSNGVLPPPRRCCRESYGSFQKKWQFNTTLLPF